MLSTASPLQSPSSLYSHAPTILHHGPHRSALARKAMNLSSWTDSPIASPSAAHSHSTPRGYHAPNMDLLAEYEREADSYPDGDSDIASVSEYSPPPPQRLSGLGPKLRKYAELRFDGEGEVDESAGGEAGRRRNKEWGMGEWGMPESALTGLGRHATRIVRAATGASPSSASTTSTTTTSSLDKDKWKDRNQRRGAQTTSPFDVQGLGVGFGAEHGSRDFLTSASAASIASNRSRSTTSSDRLSASDCSVISEAVITPNLSSAFTPLAVDASTRILPSRYGSKAAATQTDSGKGKGADVPPLQYGSSYAVDRVVPVKLHAQVDSSRSRYEQVTPTLDPSAQVEDPTTSSSSAKTANPNLSPSPALFNLTPTPSSFAASDRPLLSSGSPGFGLISLEAAQERERERITGIKIRTAHDNGLNDDKPAAARQAGASSAPRSSTSSRSSSDTAPLRLGAAAPAPVPLPTPTSGAGTSKLQKIRNKKSLIALFKSATSYASAAAPPIPSLGLGLGGRKIHIGEPLPLVRPENAIPAGQGGKHPYQALESSDHLADDGLVLGRDSSRADDGGPDEVLSSPQHELQHTPRQGCGSYEYDRDSEQHVHVHDPPSGLELPPPTAAEGESDTGRLFVRKPQLELRPISMTFTNALPVDYLSTTSVPVVPDFSAPGVGVPLHPPSEHLSFSPYTGRLGEGAVNSGTDTPRHTDSSSSLVSSADANHTDAPEIAQLKRDLANMKKAHQYQLSELSSQARELRDQLATTTEALHRAEADAEERGPWAPRSEGCTACGCTCGMTLSWSNGQGKAGERRYTVAEHEGAETEPESGLTATRARNGTTKSSKSTRSARSAISARTRAERNGEDGSGAVGANDGEAYGRKASGVKGGVMDRARVKTGGSRGVFGTGNLYQWE